MRHSTGNDEAGPSLGHPFRLVIPAARSILIIRQRQKERNMPINEHYLRTLEYDKIIQQLAGHTAFSASRELAIKLRPETNVRAVRLRLQETTEAKDLISKRTDITVGGTHDIRDLAYRASLASRLQPADLLDIRYTLESGARLRGLIVRLKETYPLLADIAWEIQPLTEISDEIARCLDEDGRVQDSASPTLARLRRESQIARDRLMDRLRRIITNSNNAPYLQEALITERNGRYVVPLKVEYRGRIEGIIHDQSSSGATLFIEPLVTVELNNHWHGLQLAEQREVDRILLALSETVGAEAEAIHTNVATMASLDLIFAKARYSFALKATPADIVEAEWPLAPPAADVETEMAPSRHPVHLINARHPLLPSDEVVPITVYIGGDYTVLLVTGPNTGGKTVTLKTVGLLAAMNQAGLHIPATPGSHLPVFSGIYADIGDEQSIEQSLSTFSSHMVRVVDILEHIDEGALVLLDELGAGTDPIEGAALAQSLIERLLRTQCLALCSTHYSQLKVYAYSTPGLCNGSVEFDIQSLSPTYRLLIGLPGRSNAFAIAQRLGLDDEIIAHARALLSPDAQATDELLGRVKHASEGAERALHQAEEARSQAQAQQETLRIKLANIEEARRQVLNEAREQGRQELAHVREVVRRLRTGLIAPGGESTAVEEIRETLAQLEQEVAPLEPATAPPPPKTKRLRVGDTVRVTTLDKEGELLAWDGSQAEVQLGGLRLRTERESLRFVSRPQHEPEVSGPAARTPSADSPGIEIDLRGMRADEVTPPAPPPPPPPPPPLVNSYIDRAYLAGLPWVHLIHGKGTGVLKQIVRDMLKSHKLVDSFRPGDLREGGEGITVAKLHSLSG